MYEPVVQVCTQTHTQRDGLTDREHERVRKSRKRHTDRRRTDRKTWSERRKERKAEGGCIVCEATYTVLFYTGRQADRETNKEADRERERIVYTQRDGQNGTVETDREGE